jgi:hypothetical protein
MDRCACGAFVTRCKACGRVPGQELSSGLFDYRATPERVARIDARVKELRGYRSLIDRFIDNECKKEESDVHTNNDAM